MTLCRSGESHQLKLDSSLPGMRPVRQLSPEARLVAPAISERDVCLQRKLDGYRERSLVPIPIMKRQRTDDHAKHARCRKCSDGRSEKKRVFFSDCNHLGLDPPFIYAAIAHDIGGSSTASER